MDELTTMQDATVEVGIDVADVTIHLFLRMLYIFVHFDISIFIQQIHTFLFIFHKLNQGETI